MTKTRLRLAALAVLAFALLSSACFQIRTFAITGERALFPGDETTFKIDLYPQSTANHSTGYVFLLIGTQDLDFSGMSSFDTKGNFGGPFTATTDTSLETFMLASDRCSAGGVSATDVDAASFDDWRIYRTPVEVDSSIGGFSERFRIKPDFSREAGTDDSSYGSVVMFSGTWIDDGDGVEESGEVYCTSSFQTSIPFKPALP